MNYLTPEYLHHLPKKLCAHQLSLPFSPSPSPWQLLTHLPSQSCKQTQADTWAPASGSFSLSVGVSRSTVLPVNQGFVPLYDCWIPHCMYVCVHTCIRTYVYVHVHCTHMYVTVCLLAFVLFPLLAARSKV